MGATVFPKPLDHEVDENAQAESSTSLIVARHNLDLGAFTSANFYALVTDIATRINTSYPLSTLALGSIVTGSLAWTNEGLFYYVYTSTDGYGTLQISSTYIIGEATINKSTCALIEFRSHNTRSLAIDAISNAAPKAIAIGQYINWDGALRKAKAVIALGETLSSSNLENVTDGGLNDLKQYIEDRFAHVKSNTRWNSLSPNDSMTVEFMNGCVYDFACTNDSSNYCSYRVIMRSDIFSVITFAESECVKLSFSKNGSNLVVINSGTWGTRPAWIRWGNAI